jgi:hypothetical protein
MDLKCYYNVFGSGCHELSVKVSSGVPMKHIFQLLIGLVVYCIGMALPFDHAWGQSVSGVRSFDGGVGPLFNLVGPGNLYLDNQGTQGYLYTPGTNFESYSFRNPTTGQAWSGAVMTLGPQLSIGLIQGANQPGTGIILPRPPLQTPPLLPIESSILDDIP